jgi:biotin synthase-related radical SAM superfamily protein
MEKDTRIPCTNPEHAGKGSKFCADCAAQRNETVGAPKKLFKKLEDKILKTTVGIELWFDREEYERDFVKKKKTFEEYFEEILERKS